MMVLPVTRLALVSVPLSVMTLLTTETMSSESRVE